MSRNQKSGGGLAKALLIVLILLLIAATAFLIWLCIDMVNTQPQQIQTPQVTIELPTEVTTQPLETTEPPTTAPPEPEHVVATATIASQGDLLMHKPVFDTCRQSDGSYDFSSIFRYSKAIPPRAIRPLTAQTV